MKKPYSHKTESGYQAASAEEEDDILFYDNDDK